MLYCEEAAYMDLGVFYEVVVPLLEMGNAVLVMISTPVDSFNFYSILMNLTDPATGERLFLVYEMELICKRCKKKTHPEKCRHNLKYLPPWKSSEKHEIIALILKDRVTTLMRESMCVCVCVFFFFLMDVWLNLGFSFRGGGFFFIFIFVFAHKGCGHGRRWFHH